MTEIRFQNSADEVLLVETVEAPCDVPEAIIKMLAEIPELFDGDKFVVRDTD